MIKPAIFVGLLLLGGCAAGTPAPAPVTLTTTGHQILTPTTTLIHPTTETEVVSVVPTIDHPVVTATQAQEQAAPLPTHHPVVTHHPVIHTTPPNQGVSGFFLCHDGTVSHAKHKSGACSHHGGVVG